MQEFNGYELSRKWFDFCFENPEIIRPIHSAIYFFAIEHCNRLGWKSKFGFPSQMAMEAIGVKNWRTYSSALNDLIEFGFIEMIEISKNQYSSNIIAIVKNTKAQSKALDKALQKHGTKHSQSTVSIDKQETINKEQNIYTFSEFYDTQISQTNNQVYKDFVKFLFGENIDKKPLTGVLSIRDQLTEKHFDLLLAKCNGNKKMLGDTVTKIENDKKYWKDKTNLYRTILNWLEGKFLKN